VILAIVSSDPSFHSDVRAAVDSRFRFEAVWNLGYEDSARLLGLKSDQQCLNIVDFGDHARALTLARTLSGRPQITTIGLNCGASREEILALMQAGVRDVVPQFSYRDLLQAVNRALAMLGTAGEIVADVYSFVPAKPGCGATTLATQAAAMAAQMGEEPTLLLDFDIRLGVTTFLLKAEGTRTIIEALQQVHRLDRDMWSSLVSQIGNLHLLGSGAADFSSTFEADHFRELLDFAVRQYNVVSVDLPGSMEDYECDVLLRSKSILLVCTPDIGALHVARRKSQWLRDLHLAEKVSVVVNCVEGRNSLSVQDVERIVGLPARHLLPAGAKDIARAVSKGDTLDPRCPLGRGIAAIAAEMVRGKAAIKKSSPVRRFVEYFSVSPARDARIG
jgi:pilus assembly protein CpaE